MIRCWPGGGVRNTRTERLLLLTQCGTTLAGNEAISATARCPAPGHVQLLYAQSSSAIRIGRLRDPSGKASPLSRLGKEAPTAFHGNFMKDVITWAKSLRITHSQLCTIRAPSNGQALRCRVDCHCERDTRECSREKHIASGFNKRTSELEGPSAFAYSRTSLKDGHSFNWQATGMKQIPKASFNGGNI